MSSSKIEFLFAEMFFLNLINNGVTLQYVLYMICTKVFFLTHDAVSCAQTNLSRASLFPKEITFNIKSFRL